jgi:hypothetical protein
MGDEEIREAIESLTSGASALTGKAYEKRLNELVHRQEELTNKGKSWAAQVRDLMFPSPLA